MVPSAFAVCDEDLLRRLPLPLAQLYRRAHNAKTPLERHLAAFYLWEAALKLLASAAVVQYAGRPDPDPRLAERLTTLARPALGHWWEYARLLVPALAERDEAYGRLRDVLLGRSRDDLPRAAGLDAALRGALEGQSAARSTVRLAELCERLVRYRNQELGHGAAGQRGGDFYDRMGAALLAGLAELLGRLDLLAGRRLLYVAEVRQAGGQWLVQRYQLHGEAARRIESQAVPLDAAAVLPRAERIYLEGPGGLTSLHPLAVFDAEANDWLFLNACRGHLRTAYLSYTTGRTAERPDLGGEQRELLARVLGTPVADADTLAWAARSQAEEPPGTNREGGRPESSRRLGEFELLSELGRGGMGRVFRAWQPSLGRQVALKEMLRSDDAKAEARFAREIRALGRVEHPHLVKIFTSGSEADRWFYAMELVEGAPLSAVCAQLAARTESVSQVDLNLWRETLSSACDECRRQETPLSDVAEEPAARRGGQAASPATPAGRPYVDQVVELIRQVAGAAHALHEAGVVHRDIKPGNIMVSADGGQAVLMDLGLAQLADDVDGRLTRTRQFVGTLRYASPEQVMSVGRLDRRSDVYSLGATLWELLTLRPLYGATEELPTPELMQRIQYKDAEPLRKHHPEIPADLEAVVQKCLEKDPDRRYATARTLADELGRLLAGESVQARAVGEFERLRRWCRRNRAVAAAVAGAAWVLVLGTVVSSLFAVHALRESRRADRETSLAKDNERQALTAAAAEKLATEAARESERRAMAAAAAERKATESALKAAAAEKRATATAEKRESETRAVLEFVEQRVLATARPAGQDGGLGRDVTVHRAIEAALPFLETSFASQPLIEARLRMTLGNSFWCLGQTARAEAQYLRARVLYERHAGPEHHDTLRSLTGLANCYAEFGRKNDALELRDLILCVRQAQLGPDHLLTLDGMNNLALSYADLGRHTEAVKLFDEGLHRYRAHFGLAHAGTLSCMNNLATSYAALGRHADALELRQETFRVRTSKLGPDHPDTLSSLAGLAASYADLGRHAEALESRQKAFRLQLSKLGPDHPDTLLSQWGVAEMLGQLGRAKEAVPLIDDFIRRAAGAAVCPELLPRAIDFRLRYFEKARAASGCRATAELWESLGLQDAESLYTAARCRAVTGAVLLAASGPPAVARQAEAEAARALDWLAKAVNIGPRIDAATLNIPDFAGLRGRKDFQALLARASRKSAPPQSAARRQNRPEYSRPAGKGIIPKPAQGKPPTQPVPQASGKGAGKK